jgi:hypothetical protein
MQIIEIAFGVFLGGMGLWVFVTYREKKKQAEYNKEKINLAFNAAERYITARYKSLSADYLDAFRGRLATIFDDPNCSALDAASIEWKLAGEHIEQTKKQITTEAQEAIKASFSIADKTDTRERLDQHIERLISDSIRSVSDELMLTYVKELQSFNDDDLPSVTQGHPRKQCNLGNAHRLGKEVAQDFQKAERLLRLSAEQGYVHAQEALGRMYYYGEGVTQNYHEALKWFLLAAAQEDAFAQNNLGLMYANGYGVTQDYQEALRWHHLSAAQGSTSAQVNIGNMYCEGEGVEQDYVRGRMWFILAAAEGDTDARNNLRVTDRSMTPDQIAEAEKLALQKDKRVLKFLLLLSGRLLPDLLSTYRDPVLLADYFTEGYLTSFTQDKKQLALPTLAEIEQWSISDLELDRCTQECVLLAAMGVVVTVKKNRPADYYSAFVRALANRVSTLLSWQDRVGAPDEIKKVIEYYIDALENERIVEFACTYTERVFSGNANESAIFAANFWDRPFAVGMATMEASKEFFTACMEKEMLQSAALEPKVQ